MKDRDCETCVHARPFGGENDNRCDAWECEYINRKEAIEAYKARRDDPLIEIVRCGECKHWDGTIEGHINVDDHLCRRRLWWTIETDFCSDGERKSDGHI